MHRSTLPTAKDLVERDAADWRDEAADLRQALANKRQEISALRDKARETEELAATSNAELGAETQSVLREANERLVIATIRARTMSETADQAMARMSYMAKHDFLTGLPNRSMLTDRVAQAIAFAERHGKKVALMYLDIDNFKHINDSLGHAVGDVLLQSVAKRLQSSVRHSDTVCRQGGDEFVVLLTEVEGKHDAVVSAEKLIESLAKPHQITGHRLRLTTSVGIAVYPEHGKDIETVVRNADIAMYHAKKNGRNDYQMFTPDMTVLAVTRQYVEESLHNAIEARTFVLHYQPKVNLRTGAVSGAEALVRLQGPDNQLVYPAQFVSVAEECSLIQQIGKWVLSEACLQAAAWLQAGLDFGVMAVNVSAVEFLSVDFPATVRSILEDSGLPPHRLELELTESGFMRDTALTAESLQALKTLGVQIAIDDFGTGYSSLSYLRRFPIDTIKIDQSFVRDLGGDEHNGNLVRAIIAIGKSLNKRIVAEGVETPDQAAFLERNHCDEGQGYYFSPAVAADAFADFLSARSH